jgi:hypothetical protein
MWLKGGVPVDTLCRGEVAEWLNAAVSKTVTSAIPASGVRIPPSPRFSTPPSAACQHVSTLRAFGFRLSASQFLLRRRASPVPTNRSGTAKRLVALEGSPYHTLADRLKC